MDKTERLAMALNTLRSVGAVKTQKDFAALLGYNEANISRALKGDPKYLTSALLERAEAVVSGIVGPKDEGPQPIVLVIPYEARGGTIGDFVDGVHDYDCEKITSPIKGADYAMEVTGDSMSPEYPSGSRVLIKKVNPIFIEWNEVYVLDTPNGAVIKRIRKTEDEGLVECVSINPAYQSYTIPRDFVRGWYRVLMVMALK